MRFATILIALFLWSATAGASTYTDSLRNLAFGSSENPAEKAHALKLLVNWFTQHQLDSAVYYGNIQLQWAESTTDTIRILRACHILAMIHDVRGKPLEASQFVDRGEQLLSQVSHLPSQFHNHNLRAAISADIADHEQALVHNQKALGVAKQLGDSAMITVSHNNLANLYTRVDDLKQAKTSYLQALEICEAQQNGEGSGIVRLNLAQLANNQEEYESAIEQIMPALEYFKANHYKNYLGLSYSTLASSYLGLHQQEKALFYAQKSKRLLEQTGSIYGIAEVYMLIGKSYEALQQNDSAHHYLITAMAMAEEAQNIQEIRSCNEALYQYYKKQGNLDQALHYYEHFTAIEDSLTGVEVREKLLEAQMRKQLNEARQLDSLNFVQLRQTERMEARVAQNKRSVLVGLGFLMIMAVIGVVVWLYLRTKARIDKQERQALLDQVQKLKTAMVSDLVVSSGNERSVTPAIHRDRIERGLGTKLNNTDWAILLELYQTPMLTNKALAEQVNMSFEGARSSLKKMYQLFGLENVSGSRKAALILKAIELSAIEDAQVSAVVAN